MGLGKIFGGDSGSRTTTTSGVDVPDWYRDKEKSSFDLIQGIADRPYEAYEGERLAGFTPDQLQAQQGIRGAYDMGAGNLRNALEMANQQTLRAGQAPSLEQLQQYINPYQQGVTDIAKREATEEADRQRQQIGSRAASMNAFGGGRSDLAQSRVGANLSENLTDIQTRGDQAAFDRAQNQYNLGTQQLGTAVGTNIGAAQGALGTTLQGLGALSGSGAQQQMQNQADLDQQYSDYLQEKDHDLYRYGLQQQGLGNINTGLFDRSTHSDTTQKDSSGWLQKGIGLASMGSGALGGLSSLGGGVGGLTGAMNAYRGIGNQGPTQGGFMSGFKGAFGFKDGGEIRIPQENKYQQGGNVNVTRTGRKSIGDLLREINLDIQAEESAQNEGMMPNDALSPFLVKGQLEEALNSLEKQGYTPADIEMMIRDEGMMPNDELSPFNNNQYQDGGVIKTQKFRDGTDNGLPIRADQGSLIPYEPSWIEALTGRDVKGGLKRVFRGTDLGQNIKKDLPTAEDKAFKEYLDFQSAREAEDTEKGIPNFIEIGGKKPTPVKSLDKVKSIVAKVGLNKTPEKSLKDKFNDWQQDPMTQFGARLLSSDKNFFGAMGDAVQGGASKSGDPLQAMQALKLKKEMEGLTAPQQREYWLKKGGRGSNQEEERVSKLLGDAAKRAQTEVEGKRASYEKVSPEMEKEIFDKWVNLLGGKSSPQTPRKTPRELEEEKIRAQMK